MLIDCDRCLVRGPGCPDCVVTALLGWEPGYGTEPGPPERAAGSLLLDEEQESALGVLAEGGLVPPLRLVLPEREAM